MIFLQNILWSLWVKMVVIFHFVPLILTSICGGEEFGALMFLSEISEHMNVIQYLLKATMNGITSSIGSTLRWTPHFRTGPQN